MKTTIACWPGVSIAALTDAQLAAIHGAPWAVPITTREIERAQKGDDK